MRFIDLFAGLGGFHLAASQLGARCVFACEIDPILRYLYGKNFGLEPNGDIREIDPKRIPPHDLLCAGFPCQPFSKAGSQLGFKDEVRGTLFGNIVEILLEHRPEFVLLENVAHFVRHDQGNTYQKVKAEMESLGYSLDSRQFSPHEFGVPQIRERMYMVGSLSGLEDFRWPEPQTRAADLHLSDVLDEHPPKAMQLGPQVSNCLESWQEFLHMFPKDTKLPSFPIWSMEFGASYPCTYDSLEAVPLAELWKCCGSFGRSLKGLSRAEITMLVPNYARGSKGVFPRWKQRFIEQNRRLYLEHRSWIDRWLPKIRHFPPSLQKLEWNCQGEPRDIWRYVLQFRASGVRVKRPTTAPSLVAMTNTQVPIIGWERRYMTMRECARLQSMDTLEHLPAGSAAVTALGNAVNVKVARLILESLLKIKNKTLPRLGDAGSNALVGALKQGTRARGTRQGKTGRRKRVGRSVSARQRYLRAAKRKHLV